MKTRTPTIFVLAGLVVAGPAVGAPVAQIHCRGDLCATPALVIVVREALAQEGVGVAWTTPTTLRPADLLRVSPGEVVRALVDLSSPGQARVALAAPAGDRFVLRDIPVDPALDEVGREAVAYVLRSAVRALVEDQELTLSRAEAEAQLRAQEPREVVVEVVVAASPAPSPMLFDASAGWGVRALDDGPHLAQGPRLGFGLGRARWAVVAELLLFQSATWATALVDTRLRGGGVRVGAGPTSARGRLWWRALVGGGVDLVRVQPRDAGAGAELAGPSTLVDPVAGVWLNAGAVMAESVGLLLSVGVDGRLFARRFELETPDGRQPVVRPWRLEPWLAGGVVWR